MHVSAWAYVVLGVVLVASLVIDLAVLQRHGTGSVRAAGIATVVWTVLGLAVTLPVIFVDGGGAGADYLTIYLLERALSLDNVAVFAIVLAALKVAPARRENLVVIGVGLALILRLLLIGGGLALVDALHATLYFFGALLILTGLNTIRSGLPKEGEEHEEGGFMIRAAKKLGRGSVVIVLLIALAVADVVFAVDSIPAAFGITRDVFPIVAANGFSVLGLHAAYVLLEHGVARFRFLDTGLGVVLVLIGVELVTEDVVHLPAWLTLVAVVGVLAAAIWLSIRAERRPQPELRTPSQSTS